MQTKVSSATAPDGMSVGFHRPSLSLLSVTEVAKSDSGNEGGAEMATCSAFCIAALAQVGTGSSSDKVQTPLPLTVLPNTGKLDEVNKA